MVSDKIMTLGVYLLVLCLAAVPVLGQNDSEESSLSPQELQQLKASRQQAREELKPAAVDKISPYISNGFLSHSPVAIVEIEWVRLSGIQHYDVDLSVEKVLRGKLPQRVAAQCYWSATPMPIKSSIPGRQGSRPVRGRRMLAGIYELSYSSPKKERTFYTEMLNLDDPVEAALFPQAQAAADLEASAVTAGLALYEKALTSDIHAIRELAFFRLVDAEQCPLDPQCEAAILDGTRALLAGNNLNGRKQAVNWLSLLAELIEGDPLGPSTYSQFPRAPVRLLLQTAVNDQNLVIGDLAFQYLAALDFRTKENNGWCEEIFPEIRTVKRYRKDSKHTLSHKLDSTEVCVEADK